MSHYLNRYLYTAIVIYICIVFVTLFEWSLISWFVGVGTGISLLGLVMIVIGNPKFGANVFLIGSVLFLPIGVIGMIGSTKVLDQLEEEDFENRKECT